MFSKFVATLTPETLSHVILKSRAEISADIFARLLRYFRLSCKNLTIKSVFAKDLENIRMMYVLMLSESQRAGKFAIDLLIK